MPVEGKILEVGLLQCPGELAGDTSPQWSVSTLQPAVVAVGGKDGMNVSSSPFKTAPQYHELTACPTSQFPLHQIFPSSISPKSGKKGRQLHLWWKLHASNSQLSLQQHTQHPKIEMQLYRWWNCLIFGCSSTLPSACLHANIQVACINSVPTLPPWHNHPVM